MAALRRVYNSLRVRRVTTHSLKRQSNHVTERRSEGWGGRRQGEGGVVRGAGSV